MRNGQRESNELRRTNGAQFQVARKEGFEVTSPGGPSTVPARVMLFAFYLVVTTLGILSMGFQLLASRLLNPHFGSSIIVWAWLISTFLAAFSAGSMVGG